ncbi:sensor histidine kinase [Halorientalis regularis]|uniref:histidine kinase n=1 Tax=Halorientalis regularis TaxID=660518 RepID=A0A1G7J217_9EURY|nr:ATP-binding protein [Halorientalis regularis]SDF18923.1 PAS fold-containing protein [Halorientalis regularis]
MASELSGVVLAYLGLPPVAVLLHVGLGYWIYRNHWDKRGTRWFVGMLALGGVYTAVTSVQLFLFSQEAKALFTTVGGFFGLTSYVAFAGFAGTYTETQYHRHPVVVVILASIPVGYLVMAPFQTVGNIWITDVWIETEPFRYLAFEPGPGLLFIIFLSYVVGFYNLYKLVVYLLSTSKRATKQLALLMAGSLSIFVIATVSNLGWFPAEHFYHGAYATIPFILLTTLALFRFDLLNVQPVARNAVVENLRDPVLVLDDEGRLVDYNAASTRIWPDLDGHVGEPFEAACPTLAGKVDPADEDEEANRLTLPTDGRDRHYSVTVSRVARRDGDDEWLSVLLRDVTALEQSRWQLQTQNERLDQVASTISHDLRNPINVADGYTEIIQRMIDADGLDAEEGEQALDHLGEIQTSHDRMEAIIDDILTIAREGKTVEDTDTVSLATAAQDAWANVDTRDATLTVDGDRTLQADRSKFLSILENLFRNALDHGPDDVTVEVDATADGFSVADDGPGIPAEHADSVFEYGYTTTDEGTGLGLSIVETMAESHGWTVEYDADSEQGARFVFGDASSEPVTETASPVVE